MSPFTWIFSQINKKRHEHKCPVSRFLWEAGLFLLLCFFVFFIPADTCEAKAADGSVIVVIDPGHGGDDNEGALYDDYMEKDMTLIVAKAMKAQLEKFEGITVYLTRSDDRSLSLQERAQIAANYNADFLFCLHFNMSTDHNLFGAETWVSAFGECYSKGYAFASIEMGLLQNMGLYSRGIKTRLNSAGTDDYYGIIRSSTALGIPCVIIEHCHLDNANDQPFYDHQAKLEAFGKLDAEAVAKYFGLRSSSLGVDYSGYQVPAVAVPSGTVRPDMSAPDICYIEQASAMDADGNVSIRMSAADYESGILYYNYSYDGGASFSDLKQWPGGDTITFTIKIPAGVTPAVVVNAYNGYDLSVTSNTVYVTAQVAVETEPEPEEIVEEPAEETGEIAEEPVEIEETEEEPAEESEEKIEAPEEEEPEEPEEEESVAEVSAEAGLTEIEISPFPTEGLDPEYVEVAKMSVAAFVWIGVACAVLVLAIVLCIVVWMKKRHRRKM